MGAVLSRKIAPVQTTAILDCSECQKESNVWAGKSLISSAPGKGTTIRAEFPVEQAPLPKSVHEQADYEESITDSDSDR